MKRLDPRIQELQARWRELCERGIVVTAEELCQDCPELACEFLQSMQTGPWPLATAENAPVTEQMAPVRLGRYLLEEQLGAGAFGAVYRGRDEQLKRWVAIKVPHRWRLNSAAERAGFLREAQQVARLDHPNVLPVFDVGEADGRCYIVYKLIGGGSLAQRQKRAPLQTTEAALLVAQIAEALDYAHRLGVYHRDIKPGNILLDSEVKAYLADFGLAVHETELSHERNLRAGTIPYMSPEQVRGEGHRIDGRSDIYSLGVVLYELLTQQRPFASEATEELMDQIMHREVRPPRQISVSIPRDLERICLKAMSKRVMDRYTTANDMAGDLHFAASALIAVSESSGMADADGAPLARKATRESSSRLPARVVPKGLRSFDVEDTDFFLDLVPGPRDREGLPDAIRFWKTRIDNVDREETFSVGVLYGPSGCGKSSLVKAGLLPRLGTHVTAVYVEASGEKTEERILAALRHKMSSIGTHGSLAAVLGELRRGEHLPPGQKLLLVLDQFEQWLHGHDHIEEQELAAALRQCDGSRVQALLLIRDDFWMSISRFMRALEIPLVEGRNCAAVDLFDLRHACKILGAFGIAFGALPLIRSEWTKAQEHFVDQAATGLAQSEKVVPVRLAVFAEMVKGKSWTPAMLKAVGGASGIGEAFLEETFSSATAPPEHRVHQLAARAVLNAMLPDSDVDIRGHSRARDELLVASGYASRPAEFDRLLQILDGELRLLTPTDLATQDLEPTVIEQPRASQRYQLTHDFLVPALRHWLTRKQQETRRGRAELRLTEREQLWRARRESRQLPTWGEWLNILLWTRWSSWSTGQRKLMAAATRLHGLQWGIAMALLITAALLIQQSVVSTRRVGQQQAAAAASENLLKSSPEDVRYHLEKLAEYRDVVLPHLQTRFTGAQPGTREKLHAGFGLAALNAAPDSYLIEAIATIPSNEMANLARAMSRQSAAADTLLDSLRRADDPKIQARYASVLLQIGDPRGAAELLRLAPDPTRRTTLIHSFPEWHGDLTKLPSLFSESRDDSFRSGVCAALALVDPNNLDETTRRQLENSLQKLYRDAPDGGTHSAAGLALRRWQAKLPVLPSLTEPAPGRNWFVNRHGMTMIRIEPGRLILDDGGTKTDPREVEVQKPVYVCDREVSLALFQQFIDDPNYPAAEKPKDWPGPDLSISPGSDYPIQPVSWYDALLFCNWLSHSENATPCYERTGEKEILKILISGRVEESTADIWRWNSGHSGYRLPTSAEWEFACRAQTTTAFYFGNDTTFLFHYGSHYPHQLLPGGSSLPNAWGISDMHGSLYEWCWDPHSSAQIIRNGGKQERVVEVARLARGGAFRQPPGDCRSDAINPVQPKRRSTHFGLRVMCCTN